MSRKNQRKKFVPFYTLMDEMLAHPANPMHPAKADFQLAVMRLGLEAMRSAESPAAEHWRVVVDCVNLMEKLVDMGEIEDEGGWIADAFHALADSARRSQAGEPIRLTPAGLEAVEAALEGYELVLRERPERVVIRAHRLVEKAVLDVRRGKRVPGAQVVGL